MGAQCWELMPTLCVTGVADGRDRDSTEAHCRHDQFRSAINAKTAVSAGYGWIVKLTQGERSARETWGLNELGAAVEEVPPSLKRCSVIQDPAIQYYGKRPS